jgi:hypothetical protein
MSDLALVFINIEGHWLRVDQIQAISPDQDTSVSKANPNLCYVAFIGGETRPYPCSPEHVLQEMGKALTAARENGTGEPPDLDDIAGEEPQPTGITETRGGSSWGRP